MWAVSCCIPLMKIIKSVSITLNGGYKDEISESKLKLRSNFQNRLSNVQIVNFYIKFLFNEINTKTESPLVLFLEC